MVIVTGGAGFIGSATVRKLNDNGLEQILIVDNLGTSEKWKNLVGKKFEDYLHKDDFIERLDDASNFSDAEAVIHFGACSSTMEQDTDYLMRNNYQYSKKLAEWCFRKNIRFIYASSAATYGDGSLGFSDEDLASAKLKPMNRYGYSKHVFDLWLINSNQTNRAAGLKFFNVFGPNEYHKGDMRSLVNKAFFQIRETGKVRLFKSYKEGYGDGEQVRDFVYIKDCLDIIWWLLRNPKVNGIFNLGTGQARSWNDLVRAIFLALETKPRIDYIDMPETIRDAYQYHTEASMTKLAATGCPMKFRSLEESVTDYVQEYLSKNLATL